MIINLESLPLEIYKRIPISIKTYKKEYELEELPYDIQKIIGEVKQEKTINYSKCYDFDCDISEHGDYVIIDNLRRLVINYMMNYMKTLNGEYPFNGSIGSKVKRLLQKKDTTTQRLFMTEEFNKMVKMFATSVDSDIKVKNFDVYKSSSNNVATEYTVNIVLDIDDESTNINFSTIL